MGSRNFQELLLRPRQETESLPHTGNSRHRAGRSSQGKACYRAEAAWYRPGPDHWSSQANGCPLRRVNQRYLVATKSKLDVAAVKVPETINDKYFARVKADKAKKEGDIFEAKKEAYKPS